MRHPRFNRHVQCRNINLLSIAYPFRAELRVRLTLGGFTFPRKPKAFGEQDFHLLYRYSYRHSHLLPLQRSLRYAFNADNNALLPLFLRTVREFGAILSPDHYRRRVARPVSYYALFKWWLLLSQHPGCHRNPTSLVTWYGFGALIGGLGSFPFDHEG